MSLFGTNNQANGSNRPTESARVNETTIVDLWVNEKSGSAWCLSRVNPKDHSKSFRTLKPDQLVDATEAVGFLAGVFSRAEDCPVDLKAELTMVNQELQAIVEKVKAARTVGSQKVNGETERTSLLAAS